MNRLPGRVIGAEVTGTIALVDVAVGDYRFTATLVGAGGDTEVWRAGTPVQVLFKEMEVSLAKNLSGLISLRNRLPATVTAIERGSILTKATLDFDGRRIESVITTRSADALELAVGDRVEGLVKANEITLMLGRAA